ncbi:uncharacterized protein C24H6.02c isoform X1 [Cornus florida]|uniref:uncharacterized protein C24H6.02c isoform X1 n=1 Tax=Cornus florida TaxID=4283 RepID=UPI0028990DC7|nr:uncharacterized protein C24H6.02c isoform X1 [Cornus florida]
MAATARATFPAISSLSCSSSATTVKARGPIRSSPCPNFFIPNCGYKPAIKPLRLGVSRRNIAPKLVFRVSIVSCIDFNPSDANPDSKLSISDDFNSEATIDLQLPRRSLLVHFTCDACGERTQKLINRLAYERGTVFVQCAGCFQHHKLVDNLGLVVEHDFREDSGMEQN